MLCGRLRNFVTSKKFFYEDPIEKQNYNHICAMMDRVDDGMRYINAHTEVPRTDNELLLFLTHVYIVVDSIKIIFRKLRIDGYNQIERDLPRHLACVCKQEPFNLPDEQITTDDTTFEYIRSIAFAHPLDTNKTYLVKQMREDHCSPFVVTQKGFLPNGYVGIHVYSDKSEHSLTIKIPYSDLNAYVRERYNLIEYIIRELERRVSERNREWAQRKVRRDRSPIEILEDILSIQEERYIHTYEVRSLISILTCHCTLSENQESLNKVRQDIISIIPALCDAVDNMDNEEFFTLVDRIIDVRPKQTYESFGYHMEKIFAYLNSDAYPSDKNWGLQQADDFSKRFAQKWVKIDVHNMDFEEIKVLVMVACYLEAQEQERKAV